MFRFTLTVAAALAVMSPSRAAFVTFGGPSASLAPSSGPWNWLGSELAPLRGAMTNTANFGPSGTVPHTVGVTELSSITPATLAGIDVFVSPWWFTGDSGAYNTTVRNWFLGGGSLLLMQDFSSRDGIGSLLGVPTAGFGAGTPSNGVGGANPIFAGVFGNAANVTQAGNTGFFTDASILAAGGTVAGRNTAGEATIAYWSAGQFAPGSGALVIAGDVDMFTRSGGISFSPTNDKGRFALNTIAFLVNQEAGAPQAVATPAPPALLVLLVGAAGLAAARRRLA